MKKELYKSDVVMQMWQNAFNKSKFGGSGSTADSLDKLLRCQDIFELIQLPDEISAAALQLFMKELSYQKLFANMKPERWL